MTIGFDQPLYVLPFDHRSSFASELFGWNGTLEPEQIARIVAAKQVIYEGFKAAVAAGVPKQHAGVLVDEQFGAGVLRDAERNGYLTVCAVERSGQDEFDFEYGDDFAWHIEEFAPTFCKVLVRYSPEADRAMNQPQADRLRRLSDFLHRQGRKLMFELLVPAARTEREKLGEVNVFDPRRRPERTLLALLELQGAGVEPDVWQVEGLDRREDCARLVAAARRGGRGRVGCIIRGQGGDAVVERSLVLSAGVPGFIGFAVGRPTFWEPLTRWRDGRESRAIVVAGIARRYARWCKVFSDSAAGPSAS